MTQFDAAKDQKERDELLEKLIKDYMDFDFSHSKPTLRDGLKATDHSESEDESNHVLPEDIRVFKRTNQTVIDECKKSTAEAIKRELEHEKEDKHWRVEMDHWSRMLFNLTKEGEGIWHELDFSTFNCEAVYQAACRNEDQLYKYDNESLLKAIAAGAKA